MSHVEQQTSEVAEDYGDWEVCEDHLGRTRHRPPNLMPIPADANVVKADEFPRHTRVSSAGDWAAENFEAAQETHFLRYEPLQEAF